MNYTIDNKYRIITERGSKGCQEKYNRNGYWYKIDGKCNEGLNEYAASLILKNSNISNYVAYSMCTVNGKKACRSKDFLKDNEMFLTLEDIIYSLYGTKNAQDYLWAFQDVSVRFNKLVDAVKIYTHGQLDITLTLQHMFYFDLFILNRDRHLNNLGIIINTQTGRFREAPIFDNGLSLLGGCQGDVYSIGLEYTVRRQNSRTISGSFVNQAIASTNGILNSPVKINFKSLFNELNKNGINRYIINVLEYQYSQIGSIYVKK
jgi:hypothetical protein